MSNNVDGRMNNAENKLRQLEGNLSIALDRITDLDHEMARMGQNLDDAGRRIGSALEQAGKSLVIMVREELENIEDGIKANSYFSGKVELAKQLANLRATAAVLVHQQETLKYELERILNKKANIQKKYDEQEKEIRASYVRDVRRMGFHIYDILENDFGHGVENRYHPWGCSSLSKVCEEVSHRRQQGIDLRWEPYSSALKTFVKKRTDFRKSLESKMLPMSQKDNYIEKLRIAFWRIFKKDESRVEDFITPGKVSPKTNEHVGFTIKHDENLEEFFSMAELSKDCLDTGIDRKALKSSDIKKLCNEISKMAQREEISEEFANFAKQLVVDHPPIMIIHAKE